MLSCRNTFIANWTTGLYNLPLKNSTNYTIGISSFLAVIQAQCSDGTLLAGVLYGDSSNNSHTCGQQDLDQKVSFNATEDGQYYAAYKQILAHPTLTFPAMAFLVHLMLGRHVSLNFVGLRKLTYYVSLALSVQRMDDFHISHAD